MPRPQPHDRWIVPEELRRKTVQLARELRQRQTPSEQLLWSQLQSHKLDGLKFRRQYPIGPFIVDFCAPSIRLIIEVDGGIHETQADHDAERQHAIESLGFHFLRLSADHIERDIASALTQIRQTIRDLAEEPSPPAPLP